MAETNKITSSENMRSIWDNDFYNTKPALSWTFKIDFTSFVQYFLHYVKTGSQYYIHDYEMQLLNQAAFSINVGERKIESTDLFYGGLTFKKLTRVDNSGTFTVGFNEDEYYSVTRVLEKLYNLYGVSKSYFKSNNKDYDQYMSNMNTIIPPTDETNSIQGNVKQNIISVKIFKSDTLDDDMSGNEYRQYKFYNCKLLGLEGFNFSYENSDTITRNATFAYDWMNFNTVYE